MIFLCGAFQGLITWMSLVSCWETCSSHTRLHVEQKHHEKRWFSLYLGIYVKGLFLGPSFDRRFWRKRLLCILPTCAGDGDISLQKSVISMCLMSLPPVSCKVQTSAGAQQSNNTNCSEKASLPFQSVFWRLCMSPVRDKTIHADVPVRAAAKWIWEQEQLDFSGLLKCCSRKPSLWTCSHTTDLWRESAA